jgi:hypothetical protein
MEKEHTDDIAEHIMENFSTGDSQAKPILIEKISNAILMAYRLGYENGAADVDEFEF